LLACNLGVIGAVDRRRCSELVTKIRAAVRERTELPDGYSFGLDCEAIRLVEMAEWMNLERLCCPFLTLQISAAGHQARWFLTITGPVAAKSILDAAFPAAAVT